MGKHVWLSNQCVIYAHHDTSLTKWSLRAMPAPASKMDECMSPLKSVETTCGGEKQIIQRPSINTRELKCHRKDRNACLVVCVRQDPLHWAFGRRLHNLLDVVVFGLWGEEREKRTVRGGQGACVKSMNQWWPAGQSLHNTIRQRWASYYVRLHQCGFYTEPICLDSTYEYARGSKAGGWLRVNTYARKRGMKGASS